LANLNKAARGATSYRTVDFVVIAERVTDLSQFIYGFMKDKNIFLQS
jgi:hypothetical protein